MMQPHELVAANRKITITDAELRDIDQAAAAIEAIRQKHSPAAGGIGKTVDSMLYNITTVAGREIKHLLTQVEEVKG